MTFPSSKNILSSLLIITVIMFNQHSVWSQNYEIEEVIISSNGEKLSGSIVIPSDKEIEAAIVFVHGSGEQTRNLDRAKQFADEGIAALVYDKRGVGKSGGTYERKQSVSERNLTLLADDAACALEVLADHQALKGVPLGLTGISQAGWIVPLAAEKSKIVDFMVIWSGPVCKVSEEDIFSKYTADLDDGDVPSYNEAFSVKGRDYYWPEFLGKDSDPSESLVKLSIPGFWIFGENDGSIPVDLSIRRLKVLRGINEGYNYALFSGIGHNNIPETFAAAADWIKRVPEK